MGRECSVCAAPWRYDGRAFHTVMAKAPHHNVYVVELSPDVWEKEARFRKANPNYEGKKPCVYVGMTGLSPKKRLAKHLKGEKANRYVYRYGVRLLPALYSYANPMPYDAAREMEVELAIGLSEDGYAVWQA